MTALATTSNVMHHAFRAVIVFSARGSYLAVDGALSALAALFIAGPLFGMDLPWPRVLAVVPPTAVVALASFCFGTFLAGIVFRFRNINGLVVLTTHVSLMAACGPPSRGGAARRGQSTHSLSRRWLEVRASPSCRRRARVRRVGT